eukprot:1155455-Pelagomonas_calceolata.AAC.3
MHHNFCQQFQAHDCDQAYTTLKSWIMQTACHPNVGMTRPLNYSVPSGYHFPTRKPLWFDAECSQKKRAVITAAKTGVAWNACQQLQR